MKGHGKGGTRPSARAAACAVATAVVVGSACFWIVRTHAGRVRVKTVRGAHGERVRVLQQGGVYQSATYLGKRRFEPVFELSLIHI